MNTDLIQGLNEEKNYTYRLLAQYQETLKEKENGNAREFRLFVLISLLWY